MEDTNPIRYYFDNLPVWDGRDYIKQLRKIEKKIAKKFGGLEKSL